jgi:signal transduction histidine kinase
VGWLEKAGFPVAVIALVVVPTAVHGWPTTVVGNVFTALLAAAGLALIWWRTHPRASSLTSLGLVLAALALPATWAPEVVAVLVVSLGFAGLALGWSGQAAWLVALGAAAYIAALYRLAGMSSIVAAVVFTVPAFAAGTVLRLRKETADQLAARARELEEERELFAALAVRHERARIASELHDIVGHAISVMVIQAAAGQRLVDTEPERAKEAFEAISESARQGTKDLEQLVGLLGGGQVDSADLSLIDEVVARARRSGLRVSCRFEGDRDQVPDPIGHIAFRVVQESLTNALRHAPGAEVRIAIGVDPSGRMLNVRVENDAPAGPRPPVTGTGRGLVGLSERVQEIGGRFRAGPVAGGSWVVEAELPAVG